MVKIENILGASYGYEMRERNIYVHVQENI